MRKISIEHLEFEWKVGRSFIRIRGNGLVKDISLSEFCGLPPSEIERNRHKGNTIPIGPGDVESYVRNHFLKFMPAK